MSGISGSDRHNWNTPIRFDATNPDRMYYGTQRVYRSTNGTSWTAIRGDLTGGSGGGAPGQVHGTLTTIDSSPLDASVIWAGSDDGRVQVTTNSGGAWTDVSGMLPDRWITSVHASPVSRETAYVTISGFRWGEPLPHLFRTTDMGASWTAIAGTLPEAPANDLAIDPSDPARLFAATDVGVFESRDGGGVSSVLGSDLPNVVVTSLALDPVTRRLTAGTYGRSIFSYDIDQPSAVAETVSGVAHVTVSPNPARGGATIRWSDAAPAGLVQVDLLSVSGRRVWSSEARGSREIRWDGREASGRSAPAGAYFMTVRTGGRELGRATLVLGR
ncbi:MAG: hypothetical protein FJY88_00935 [Candidatus Eisenbacteria bacterium]|nr:hypothetical protein [Candidatus Eisenbacteria bacterium]